MDRTGKNILIVVGGIIFLAIILIGVKAAQSWNARGSDAASEQAAQAPQACAYYTSSGVYLTATGGSVCGASYGLESQLAQTTAGVPWAQTNKEPMGTSVLSQACGLSDNGSSMTVYVLEVNGDSEPINAPTQAGMVCSAFEAGGWQG